MNKYIFFLILCLIVSCSTPRQYANLRTFDYEKPVDTKTRPVSYQDKGAFLIEGVGASNNFSSARLNGFQKVKENEYLATINAENTPINPSPWYAFKVWSQEEKTVKITLDYGEFKHRYHPKISTNGNLWSTLDSTKIELNQDSTMASLSITIGKDTTWLAAQEIQDTKRVKDWVNTFKNNSIVSLGLAGLSVQKRPLLYMNLTKGSNANKPTIIVISRQHPPEVTGFLAMKAFIETLIKEGEQNGFFDRYRVMVYPLMNPDGVDLGHFRHNTGGIDMNRDWSEYNQPEISQITNHMVREVRQHNNNVLLGLDFHSTYYDVYYTPHESVKRKIPDFTKTWLESIRVALNIEDINDSPGKGERPTSSAWFNRQFGATGITYEIGDDTPREFIKKKGEVSAIALMDYFLILK